MTDEASKEAYDVEENDSSRLEKVLSRIASRRSVASSIGPPPDGGFNAWFQVFLAHLVNFNTWGVVNSFGVFQTCKWRVVMLLLCLHTSSSDS